VQKKPVQEQVLHWTTAIEQGEFGKGSPQQYEKTDYSSYEQFLLLGEPAIPYLREQLQTELEEDTKRIIELVLQDLS